MTYRWDGITRSESLSEWAATARHELADRARAYDWAAVFDLLGEPRYAEWANAARPGGRSWYAPLHQAAYGGAPVEVARRLIEVGAWRALRTADGERPVDIARRQGHHHLREPLEPPRLVDVPDDELRRVQEHFHGLICHRAGKLVDEHRLRLPELEVLLETPGGGSGFSVPGMYGGFSFTLAVEDGRARLTTESWSRVVGGSGQRHEITVGGVDLVAEGFV
ncbi:ankyrin repeat domain-containing protein [Micromonospora sp. NPDC047548]|uniref:ankyrin repeat domain-containing protein n=1 Tax=Micromonospora sp. NPDC047548 TaxID=3155624 RepID=UPI0033F1347E